VTGRWPDFLVIGAARSGTSALHRWLGGHPQLFTTAIKEPHFFAFAGGERPAFQGPGDAETINRVAVTEPDRYRALFAKARTGQRAGESSTSYLYYGQTLGNIQRWLGAVDVVAVLRDPVERAYSAYLYMRAQGREPIADFAAALALDEERIAAGWQHIWHYRHLGYYYRQLSPFFEELGQQRVHVVVYDDLRARPRQTLAGILAFLGVDPSRGPSRLAAVNVSGLPRGRLAPWLVRSTPWKRRLLSLVPSTLASTAETALRRLALAPVSAPAAATARELREGFAEDVANLSTLLCRDLSAWLP
jgi:hypothetical protein